MKWNYNDPSILFSDLAFKTSPTSSSMNVGIGILSCTTQWMIANPTVGLQCLYKAKQQPFFEERNCRFQSSLFSPPHTVDSQGPLSPPHTSDVNIMCGVNVMSQWCRRCFDKGGLHKWGPQFGRSADVYSSQQVMQNNCNSSVQKKL